MQLMVSVYLLPISKYDPGVRLFFFATALVAFSAHLFFTQAGHTSVVAEVEEPLLYPKPSVVWSQKCSVKTTRR